MRNRPDREDSASPLRTRLYERRGFHRRSGRPTWPRHCCEFLPALSGSLTAGRPAAHVDPNTAVRLRPKVAARRTRAATHHRSWQTTPDGPREAVPRPEPLAAPRRESTKGVAVSQTCRTRRSEIESSALDSESSLSRGKLGSPSVHREPAVRRNRGRSQVSFFADRGTVPRRHARRPRDGTSSRLCVRRVRGTRQSRRSHQAIRRTTVSGA